MGSTASRLKPFQGSSLLFTTKLPEISGTHFSDLGRMKGWADLGVTQWFWTRDPWIRNPVPWPLGHYSIAGAIIYNIVLELPKTIKKSMAKRIAQKSCTVLFPLWSFRKNDTYCALRYHSLSPPKHHIPLFLLSCSPLNLETGQAPPPPLFRQFPLLVFSGPPH